MKNRYLTMLLPGILLPMALGSVYNYSQYAFNITQTFGIDKFGADIGFMLIIFFLGMCAAAFGRFVEYNPKAGAVLSTFLFVVGMIGLSVATYTGILPCYYIACCLVGAGTGIGYISPIKQLMKTFEDHKGLASGIAITGFGLGKFVMAPVIEMLLPAVPLWGMFAILAAFFLIVMSLATTLFSPNPNFLPQRKSLASFHDLCKHVFFRKEYLSIWFMFFINISCGLAIISQEKALLSGVGFTEIALIMAGTAIFNALGRLGFSQLSDMIGRKAVYHFICSFGIFAAFMCFTANPIAALIGVFMIEMAYGGNFSSVPALLQKRFGIDNASTIHAVTLTGWSFAGICGPLLANTFTGGSLYIIMAVLYLIGFCLMYLNIRKV